MNRFITTLTLITTTTLTSAAAQAGTIIKLGFGVDSQPDFELVDNVLSTFDDGFGATIGDQNSEVTFLGPLTGLIAIEGDRASFTLTDVHTTGTPTIIGLTLLQPTSGGDFRLYGPSNELLLSGTLGDGTLSGPLGGPATGGFLTTQFGTFTGGSLLQTLGAQDLVQASFAISLTDVNDGNGMAIDGNGNLLPFAGDATAIVGGQVPEPASVSLVGLAGLFGFATLRRRCR